MVDGKSSCLLKGKHYHQILQFIRYVIHIPAVDMYHGITSQHNVDIMLKLSTTNEKHIKHFNRLSGNMKWKTNQISIPIKKITSNTCGAERSQ